MRVSFEDGERLSEESANARLGFPPDLRNYQVAAAALEHLEVETVILYTGNRRKIRGWFRDAENWKRASSFSESCDGFVSSLPVSDAATVRFLL